MSEWKIRQWGDLATLEYGKSFRDYKETGKYPVYGTNGAIGFCDEPLYDKPSVIIGRKGAFRGVHFSDRPFFVIDTAFYLKPRVKFDMKWAYYTLLTYDINGMDSGSAIPSTSREDFYALEVRVPPLAEQREIAHVLSTLDDKIELNNQMNVTLETTARTIFKSWFVDFDPVHAKANGREPDYMDSETASLFPVHFQRSDMGLIPDGWSISSLDQIADYQNGLALQNFPPETEDFLPVIKIRELRQGYVDDRSDKASPRIKESCIVDDGDVLFSWSGSLMVDFWCGGKGALNQHLFKVTSEQFPKWFYYYWTQRHLEDFIDVARDKATTMGHIQRRHLSAARVVVPPVDVLPQMGNFIASLVDQLILGRLESHKLAEIRDALLPQLVSGKIRL